MDMFVSTEWPAQLLSAAVSNTHSVLYSSSLCGIMRSVSSVGRLLYSRLIVVRIRVQ